MSIAELDWFSIPDTIKNISIRFKWRDTIKGMLTAYSSVGSNAGLWFEITTDRKTWHKLAYFYGTGYGWSDYSFSLNKYIGSDFFQARFRLESSGSEKYSYTKRSYITDVEIVYNDGNNVKKYETPYIKNLIISPNPTTGIVNITTSQENDYQISVYDMMGKLLFQQDVFFDGNLDISFLSKGTYLIVASIPNYRIAKKLIVN